MLWSHVFLLSSNQAQICIDKLGAEIWELDAHSENLQLREENSESVWYFAQPLYIYGCWGKQICSSTSGHVGVVSCKLSGIRFDQSSFVALRLFKIVHQDNKDSAHDDDDEDDETTDGRHSVQTFIG